MLYKNNLFKFYGVILATIFMGISLHGDEAKAQNAIATLANGNYQFCSQPKPNDWRNGAGVCFNFSKVGDRIDGYYGYPHSGDLICLRGKVSDSLVTGEALSISSDDRPWTNIPKAEFNWDQEGHLSLKDSKVIRTAMDRGGKTEWILFSYAKLDTGGFYQYQQPLMTSPSQLCKW